MTVNVAIASQLVLPGNVNRVLLVLSAVSINTIFIWLGDVNTPELFYTTSLSPTPLELRRVDIGPVINLPVFCGVFVPTDLYVTEGLCLDPLPDRLGC